MPNRKFDRAQMIEWDIPHSDICISNEVVDSSRWTNIHECVFEAPDDGKFYRFYYESGLTEIQECSWYEELNNPQECEEVQLIEKTVVVKKWVPVGN